MKSTNSTMDNSHSPGLMARKVHCCRARVEPHIPKYKRVLPWQCVAIVASDKPSAEEVKVWDYKGTEHVKVNQRAINRIRQRAKERAKTASGTRSGQYKGVPAVDISVNRPLTHERAARVRTSLLDKWVCDTVTENRKSRRTPLDVHQARMHAEKRTTYSISSMQQALYDAGYSFRKTSAVIPLTEHQEDMRVDMAVALLAAPLHACLFLDAASIRVYEESDNQDKCWHRTSTTVVENVDWPNEEYHVDVVKEKHTGYSSGQFFGAIGYDQPNTTAPYKVFLTET